MGTTSYQEVWELQKDLQKQRISGDIEDTIILTEHKAVYTLGKNASKNHLLQNRDMTVDVFHVERGGDITFHGPGQLVIYFLLDVKKLNFGPKKLVSTIQEFVKDLLADLSIDCNFVEGAPGVYVNQKKIASIGLRISKGKSYHGISINFDMDLSPFKQINPCGYEGLEVTQIKDLNKHVSKLQLEKMVINLLKNTF